MPSIDRVAEFGRRWTGLLVLAGVLVGLWHAAEAHAGPDSKADCQVCFALAHAAPIAVALAAVVRSVVSATPTQSTLRLPSTRRTLRLCIRPPPAATG